MNGILIYVASFTAGIMASMGLGGGMILIVFLTVFDGVSQLNAQGINLVFFLPIAVVSLIFHTKNKLIEWKKIYPAIITGTITAGLTSFFVQNTDQSVLRKFFGIFLIITGALQLFRKKS